MLNRLMDKYEHKNNAHRTSQISNKNAANNRELSSTNRLYQTNSGGLRDTLYSGNDRYSASILRQQLLGHSSEQFNKESSGKDKSGEKTN